MAIRRFLNKFVMGAAVILVWTGSALAVAPEIKDQGKFFSEEAVKKANEGVREISRKYGKDLLIETFPSVPADKLDKVKAMSSDEKKEFFKKWAEERMNAVVVNGVYILACKSPTYLQIEVTPQTRQIFNHESFKKLRGLLLEEFHGKRFDDGLQKAVKFVMENMGEQPSSEKKVKAAD